MENSIEKEAVELLKQEKKESLEKWSKQTEEILKKISQEEQDLAFVKIYGYKPGISHWMKASNDLAHEKGWYEEGKQSTFVEKMMLIVSECSEVVEEYRAGKAMNEVYFSEKGKPEGIPIECADIFIRLMDTCQEYGIDLESAVNQKHEFNKTRPNRHGGKKI